MKARHRVRALAVTASLLLTAPAYSRGGETGTLDEVEPASKTILDGKGRPVRVGSPYYYLAVDQFRRLRARLQLQRLAPIPGWDSYRAKRERDRYFTEDGAYEILPLLPGS